jgi:hypothetical protein
MFVQPRIIDLVPGTAIPFRYGTLTVESTFVNKLGTKVAARLVLFKLSYLNQWVEDIEESRLVRLARKI